MCKPSILKIGLSHALDTGGHSREENIRRAKLWRTCISSIPGLVCIAPWIDIADANKKPINRKTRAGKALLAKVLAVDVQINELMDLLIVVMSAGGGLSEGQQFEFDTASEQGIPILRVKDYEIGDLALDPEGFISEILEVIKTSKKDRK